MGKIKTCRHGYIRIKPGSRVQTKHEVGSWYTIVLGFKPYGYKKFPYVIIAAGKLPEVFTALANEYYEKNYTRDFIQQRID